MIRTIGMICILAILVPVTVSADDEPFIITSNFRDPIYSPTPEGFFIERMNLVHGGMAEMGGPDVFFIDAGGASSAFHILTGSMLPVWETFAIPVYFQWFSTHNFEDDSFFIGSGLVFHGYFGMLAGYAGYMWGKVGGYESGIYNAQDISKFQWAFFPVINAAEFPILNTVVKQIDGFLASLDNRMNAGGFQPSYKANFLFKDIPLDKEEIWYATLGTYTASNWYDDRAKYRLYAGRADISFSILKDWLNWRWTIIIEAGYRDFFDIQIAKEDNYSYSFNNKSYENGLYSKIGFAAPFDIGRMMFTIENGPDSTKFLGNPQFSLVLSLVIKGRSGGGFSLDYQPMGRDGATYTSLDIYTAQGW